MARYCSEAITLALFTLSAFNFLGGKKKEGSNGGDALGDGNGTASSLKKKIVFFSLLVTKSFRVDDGISGAKGNRGEGAFAHFFLCGSDEKSGVTF